MKKILFISIIIMSIIPLCIFPQSGIFNNGAYIEITSSTIVEIEGNSGDYINDDDGSGTDGEIDLDGSIKLGGDWINQAAGSGNVFVNRDTDGEVEFNGGAAQLIDGSAETKFEKVKINNSAANVTLDVNATIEGTLTLTLNDIVLGSNTLSLGKSSADATISGGSATTYIQADGTGVVKFFHKTGATDYAYPVGCASFYTPFTFNTGTSTLAAGAYTTLNLTNAVHPNKGAQTDYLTRYWTLEPSGITDINYEVSYVYNEANDVVGTESEIVPKKYSSSAWTAGTTINEATNTLSWTGLTSFSDFSGFTDDALPVEFLSFDAKLINNNTVELTWQTATEINNDYFVVETSNVVDTRHASSLQQNDFDWQLIATINGNGTTNTITNYQYTDDLNSVQANNVVETRQNNSVQTRHASSLPIYYRLKQVDFNGDYSYSEIKSVQVYSNTHQQSISTLNAWYAGNTEQKIQYEIESNNENQITAHLYDIMGRIVATQNTSIIEGHNESSISTNNLPKGQYILYIKGRVALVATPARAKNLSPQHSETNINLKKKITIF